MTMVLKMREYANLRIKSSRFKQIYRLGGVCRSFGLVAQLNLTFVDNREAVAAISPTAELRMNKGRSSILWAPIPLTRD